MTTTHSSVKHSPGSTLSLSRNTIASTSTLLDTLIAVIIAPCCGYLCDVVYNYYCTVARMRGVGLSSIITL